MNPYELNAAIAAISNYLYASLSKEDFALLNVFLSELSKTMFSMELMNKICADKHLTRRENPESCQK